jgi:uncharacterized membrane protein YphA (DoxX/SURF4 family)
MGHKGICVGIVVAVCDAAGCCWYYVDLLAVVAFRDVMALLLLLVGLVVLVLALGLSIFLYIYRVTHHPLSHDFGPAELDDCVSIYLAYRRGIEGSHPPSCFGGFSVRTNT